MFRTIIGHIKLEKAWVGLEKLSGEIWKWTDHVTELTNSSRWRKNKPNDKRDSEDCAELWRNNAGLNDISCSKSRRALCEKSLITN